MEDSLGAIETAMAVVVYVMMIKVGINMRVLTILMIILLVMMIMAVTVKVLVLMLVVMNRQGYSRRWSLFILGSGILSLRHLLDFICPLIISTRSSIRLLLLVVAAMARFRAPSSTRSRSPAVTLAPAPKVRDGGNDDYNEGDSNGETNRR